jgi:hypothetical protein
MSPIVPILAAVLAQAAVSRPPGTTQEKAKAQALLTEGAELYDRGDLVEALGRFQSAYAAYPSPKLYFNIGQAQRDLGRQVEAMEAFEHFVAEAKDAPPAALAEARRSMVELRGKLGHVTISCATRGALVSIDGRRVGTTPLPGPLWLTPGIHQIGVGRHDLAPAVQRVDVVPGKEATITFQLRMVEAKPATPPPAPTPPAPTAAPLSPAPELAPVPPSEPTVLVAARSARRPTEPPAHDAQASWQSLSRNWRFWAGVGGAIVLTSIVFGIASSGGDSDAPTTTLGSQPAFQ